MILNDQSVYEIPIHLNIIFCSIVNCRMFGNYLSHLHTHYCWCNFSFGILPRLNEFISNDLYVSSGIE